MNVTQGMVHWCEKPSRRFDHSDRTRWIHAQGEVDAGDEAWPGGGDGGFCLEGREPWHFRLECPGAPFDGPGARLEGAGWAIRPARVSDIVQDDARAREPHARRA